MGNLGGWEIVIILGVLVLLFGARRLPDMARSIGQSARVFKGEMKGLKDDDEKAPRTAHRDEPGAGRREAHRDSGPRRAVAAQLWSGSRCARASASPRAPTAR